MYLGEARGGDGLAGEPRERRAGVGGVRDRNVGRDAEFGAEKVERGVGVEGWHAVLEGSERGGSLGADEILARREGLAEFDVHGAEGGDGVAEDLAAVGGSGDPRDRDARAREGDARDARHHHAGVGLEERSDRVAELVLGGGRGFLRGRRVREAPGGNARGRPSQPRRDDFAGRRRGGDPSCASARRTTRHAVRAGGDPSARGRERAPAPHATRLWGTRRLRGGRKRPPGFRQKTSGRRVG